MPLFHAVQHRLQDIENGAWRNSRKNLAGNYHGLELMYLLHNAMVQCLVPKEQLLVVDVFHQDNQQIYDTVRRFLGPELAKGTATGPLDPKVWHDKSVQTNEAQKGMTKELHRQGRLQTAMKLASAVSGCRGWRCWQCCGGMWTRPVQTVGMLLAVASVHSLVGGVCV